jgi:hypothetical protein
MPEVKLLKRMAGPDGNHSPGFVMKVDADTGQQLVDQGAAEWVAPIRQKPIERAVVEPVERATVETVEKEKPEKIEEKLKAKGRKKQG